MDTKVQCVSAEGHSCSPLCLRFLFSLSPLDKSLRKQKGNATATLLLLQTSFNQSFLFASQAASAGCHRLKITISPPLSCLINNSDVQFRNFAINLLKYCWRMLIVMPVAIKTHLHNVCAKNNYELLIAQEPAESARSDGGGARETFARWVLVCADGGTALNHRAKKKKKQI